MSLPWGVAASPGGNTRQVQSALGSQEALVEFIRYRHYLGKKQWEYRCGAVIFCPKRDVAMGRAGGCG